MSALEGIQVADFSRVLAGPFCTMLLADFGAEVIKVENPEGGDDTRAWGPPFQNGESAYFLSANRNKKSIALNLKDPQDRQVAWKLICRSDVLVENFRPGTMEKLGFGWPQVSAKNPKIIYASISGYGLTGPEKDRPGYDLVAQGLSGLMDLTGDPSGPPFKFGTSIADLVAGLYAAIGILLALHARGRTGKGQRVDVSLLDGMVSLLTYQAGIYFATGKSPTRMGNRHPTISPYETFRAKDGYLNIAVGSEKLWEVFCEAIGAPALLARPEFRTNADRVKNRDTLFPIVDKIIGRKPRDHWLKLLEDKGIPAGPILSVGEILEHPQIRAREMVVEAAHKKLGKWRGLGVPVKLSDTPGSVRAGPPVLGEHSEEIRRRLSGE